MEVVEDGGVSTRFFQNGGDGSSFEGCRNSLSGERGVDDGRDEGDQRREAGFDQLCGERVQLTDEWLGFPDEFSDFQESGELEGGE